MNVFFTPVFNSTGIPKPLVNICGNYLIKVHNRMAELTDGKYKEWNKEYDETHTEVDIQRLKEDAFDPEYMTFMNQKLSDYVIDTLNKEFPMMYYTIGEEHQLVGHIHGLKNSSIDFAMKEVLK
jgi:hypothetical protein